MMRTMSVEDSQKRQPQGQERELKLQQISDFGSNYVRLFKHQPSSSTGVYEQLMPLCGGKEGTALFDSVPHHREPACTQRNFTLSSPPSPPPPRKPAAPSHSLNTSDPGMSRAGRARPSSSTVRNPPEPGLWQCSTCTLDNGKERFACKACGCERSGVWQCPERNRCKRGVNATSLSQCVSCGAWKCERCAKVNFRSSAVCVKCNGR